MQHSVGLSHHTLRVLRTFLSESRALAGSDIAQRIALRSGTLYPTLRRLERAGWLKSRWERIDPAEAGRPRKRLYRLTPRGRKQAGKALGELGIG